MLSKDSQLLPETVEVVCLQHCTRLLVPFGSEEEVGKLQGKGFH